MLFRPELLRAAIDDGKTGEQGNDLQDKGTARLGSAPPTNSWEELDDSAYEPLQDDASNHDPDASGEIDLDELDKYYDELHQIISYLATELPKVIPTIANDANCFQSLANKVLAAPRNSAAESKVLENFLNYHSVPSRIKALFTSEYVKFRKFSTSQNQQSGQFEKTAFEEAKDFFKDPIAINSETRHTSPRAYGGAQPKIRAKPTTRETNDPRIMPHIRAKEDQSEGMDSVLEGKIRSRVKDFLSWLEGAVRSKEIFAQKHQLYSAVLSRPSTLTRYLHVLLRAQKPD